MRARHISHTRGGRTLAGIRERSGIYIHGHRNRLADSEIAYSAGNGVSLGGTDNAVVNCWIHHTDSIGAYCSLVSLGGLRHLISHCTLAHTGRDCIKLGGAEHLIQFNDIGHAGRICHDLGMIYSGGMDGGNTRIRYNVVHDNPGSRCNVGIYLDNYMKNYIVDHNVVWNVGNGIRLNRPTGFCMILNNTVFSDINNSWGPWKAEKVQWGCHVMNNLCSGPIRMNPEVAMRANIAGRKLDGCFNTKTRTRGAANPGKGKGVAVVRITPPERVDVGAFQHDTPAWRAGHDFANPPEAAYVPATEPLRNHIRNASFEYGRYCKGMRPTVDPLVHWTKTHAAAAVVKHHPGFNFPAANARDSVHGNSVRLDGDGDNGIEQRITSLTPNTPYCFSGYVKHAENVTVDFRVRLSGEVVVRKSSRDVQLGKGHAWRFVQAAFKTGPADRSAVVAITKTGSGVAHVDDTGVVPTGYATREK
jgi:hypothetical protein